MRINHHPMDEKVCGIRVNEFFSERRREPYRYEFRAHSGELAVMTFSEDSQDWSAYETNGKKTFIARNDDPDTLINVVLAHLSAKMT